MSYTPGLQVKASTRYRVTRTLPIPGEILVRMGDRVTADQVVARTDQPGDVIPVNVAHQLSVTAADAASAMRKSVGERVGAGEILAQSNGLFGYFRQSCFAPQDGTIESISRITGQVILRGTPSPVEVLAFVAGVVVEVIPQQGVVIETDAAFIQGIFGIGGEQLGRLRVIADAPHQDLTPEMLKPEHAGCVIVAGGRIHGETVSRGKELGVHGIISGGIDDQDLKEILGYDLGVAITGSERVGLTLIITEGFGDIAMSQQTFSLLKSMDGRLASINGATQIRAGVLRPEIVIPRSDVSGENDAVAERVAAGELAVGETVRLIRDPYFGELGVVSELPVEPVVLASGSKARVLKVRCDSGRDVVVPRANVEIVVK